MAVLDIPAIIYDIDFNGDETWVGGDTALSSNDGDTTYVEFDKPDTGISITGYQLEVTFPATPIPGTVESVSMVTVAKGTANLPTFLIRPEGTGGSTYGWTYSVGASYAEVVTPMQTLGVERVTQDDIEAGTVEYYPDRHTVLFNDVDDDAFLTRFTYIALRVVYSPESVVRNWPRPDGLGHASSARNYPPHMPRGFGDAP